MPSWGITRADTSDAPPRFGRRPERPDRERERERARQVSIAAIPDIQRALSMLPAVTCVMTASFEAKRNGMIVSRVMKASDEPACVCVAVPSGQRLATLIRDSHAFGLCMIDPASRLLLKKFGVEESPDPFDMLETRTLVTGSPLLARSIVALDCEVLRHVDLEADYEIYVGQVLSAFVGSFASSGGATMTVPGRNAAGSAE